MPSRVTADTNCDGVVSSTDFSAFINAYNSGSMLADQNHDGQLTPTDFNAWTANHNMGIDGPFSPWYDCAKPTPVGLLATFGNFPTSGNGPTAVYNEDPNASGGYGFTGQLQMRDTFPADLIPRIIRTDRYMPGDDPSQSPPTGKIHEIVETTQIVSAEYVAPSGATWNFVGYAITFTGKQIDESTGVVDVDYGELFTSFIHVARYPTYNEAYIAAAALSEQTDLLIEEPGNYSYPYTGQYITTVPMPLDLQYDIDTEILLNPNDTLQIDCESSTLTCEERVNCAYGLRVAACYASFRGKTAALLGGAGGAVGACTIAGAICIGHPPCIPLCCGAGILIFTPTGAAVGYDIAKGELDACLLNAAAQQQIDLVDCE